MCAMLLNGGGMELAPDGVLLLVGGHSRMDSNGKKVKVRWFGHPRAHEV